MPPIILHHGLFGFGEFKLGPLKMSYFRGIDTAIAARGHQVILPKVHPTGSIALRAQQLKDILLERFNGQKFIIIAHSMGGLDARHMIAHLGMADRVHALVTISTPHRGSPYADWALKHIANRIGLFQIMKSLKIDSGAFADLSTERCARFNETTPDVPGVRYYSISASRPWHKVPVWALHSWRVIHAAEGDNDGLVSVQSAAWAQHLETWPADHWHTINKRFVVESKSTGTGDIVPYYMKLLDQVLSPPPSGAFPAGKNGLYCGTRVAT
jgi:triacylglycerol lipase